MRVCILTLSIMTAALLSGCKPAPTEAPVAQDSPPDEARTRQVVTDEPASPPPTAQPAPRLTADWQRDFDSFVSECQTALKNASDRNQGRIAITDLDPIFAGKDVRWPMTYVRIRPSDVNDQMEVEFENVHRKTDTGTLAARWAVFYTRDAEPWAQVKPGERVSVGGHLERIRAVRVKDQATGESSRFATAVVTKVRPAEHPAAGG